MALVYMATNLINGKRYIGVTAKNLRRRATEHRSGSRKTGYRTALSRAMAKYGPEMFRFSILRGGLAREKAFREEIRLIALLKPEYNLTPGGEGVAGEVNRGNAYRLGKPHTPDTRRRLREHGLRDRAKWLKRSHLGPAACRRPVVCLDDGQVHESASAAARAYGVSRSALIELCLGKNYRKSVGGLRFSYCAEDAHAS